MKSEKMRLANSANAIVRKEKQRKERLGKVNYNTFGTKMIIVKYIEADDISIQFEDEYKCIVDTSYSQFKSGSVKNPYDKTVHNIGYIGEGDYKSRNDDERTKQYNIWSSMLLRCHSKKFQEKHTAYKECVVCKEWLNYQNFAEWYDGNYYEIDNEEMAIDKDILMKGNKIYSPDNCVFVPERINNLFIKKQNNRGGTPMGVTFYKQRNKYISQCSKDNAMVYLGIYNTPEEAFSIYKSFKENLIKQMANEYKNKIPQKLYDAMIRYKIEITD